MIIILLSFLGELQMIYEFTLLQFNDVFNTCSTIGVETLLANAQ